MDYRRQVVLSNRPRRGGVAGATFSASPVTDFANRKSFPCNHLPVAHRFGRGPLCYSWNEETQH
ncbi:MAG TPA: hypothetical protein VME43_22660, partial [Bryobacteraceae bacterium]|nr:hypothetical protein [Bryobacteraceae bacterium]